MYGVAVLFPGHPYIESATALSDMYEIAYPQLDFTYEWVGRLQLNLKQLQLYNDL